MPAETPKPTRFPLLETLLAHKGQQLQPTYCLRDLAELFGVSIRAIQDRVKRGELKSRNLPGRAKFLSIDIEADIEVAAPSCDYPLSEREKSYCGAFGN